MKKLIKIFFILTFTSILFAENDSEIPSPAPVENEILSNADNENPEGADENNTSLQDNTSSSDTDKISSSDEETPLEDIRDIRPAVDLPTETWQIIVLSCVILALLFLLVYAIKKHYRKAQGISIIPPDPYHKALQGLEAALQLIQRLDQRPFATGITDAVREYLAAVFSLPAPEYTTEEVLEQLPNVTLLTEELRLNITHLLQQCDLAKFTKLQFDQPERLKLYQQAKEFIQSSDKLIQLQNANTPEQ